MSKKDNMNKEDKEKELSVLEKFIKETQEGRYTVIDKSSFPYLRVEEQREEYFGEEELYFYSTQ